MRGAAGVDGQSVADFEANLSDGLQLDVSGNSPASAGSNGSTSQKATARPKRHSWRKSQQSRNDQEVVKRYLEPILEPIFHTELLRVSAGPVGD